MMVNLQVIILFLRIHVYVQHLTSFLWLKTNQYKVKNHNLQVSMYLSTKVDLMDI